MTKEGKSKVVKCDFQNSFPTQHGELHGFKVAFEDGTEGLYNAKNKDNPKFKVGEIAPYTAEEKTNKNGNKYWSIKYRNEQQQGSGGHKGIPSYLEALGMARRMFNSSAHTDDVWDIKRMKKTATYLLGKINGGIDKDAVDAAVTIQCNKAMFGQKINGDTLKEHIKEIQEWINQNK